MGSLLDDAYEDFVILNKSVIDDGYGGTKEVYADGITIKGVMVYDNGTQMKIAQQMGVTDAYTFTVKKTINLSYHTVLRRKSDSKIFRLTSGSDDKKTPDSANLNMRQYSAEEWRLPS